MSNLIPETRINKNGVPVVKHVRASAQTASTRAIPPVQPSLVNDSDWSEIMRRLRRRSAPEAIQTLRTYQPDAIPHIAAAMRSRYAEAVMDMFDDKGVIGVGLDAKGASEFADMCYYNSTGDLEDITTSEFALSLLHKVREKQGVKEQETFHRAEDELRDNIGKVLSVVESSRFIASSMSEWNYGGSSWKYDYEQALGLAAGLYERVSAGENMDRHVEAWEALRESEFIDFDDDSSDGQELRVNTGNFMELADAMIAASDKTRMEMLPLVDMMMSRGIRDGQQLTEKINSFEGAPILFEGSL